MPNDSDTPPLAESRPGGPAGAPPGEPPSSHPDLEVTGVPSRWPDGGRELLAEDRELSPDLLLRPPEPRAFEPVPLGDDALDVRGVLCGGGDPAGRHVQAGEGAGEVGEEARQVVLDLRLVHGVRAGGGRVAPEPGHIGVKHPLELREHGVGPRRPRAHGRRAARGAGVGVLAVWRRRLPTGAVPLEAAGLERLDGGGREPEQEGRPDAHLASRRHVAPHEPGESTADGEPEPRPAVLAGERHVGLHEGLEVRLEPVGRDADPGSLLPRRFLCPVIDRWISTGMHTGGQRRPAFRPPRPRSNAAANGRRVSRSSLTPRSGSPAVGRNPMSGSRPPPAPARSAASSTPSHPAPPAPRCPAP